MQGESNIVPNENERAGLSYYMQHKINVMPKLLSRSAGRKECCIFRVPEHLAEINKQAYCPRGVSIGPYHHGEEHLQMLEEYKWRLLGSLLARCEPHGIHLKQLIDAISLEEDRIRESYWECINKFSSDELVTMMVLDGCFIIEILALYGGLVQYDEAKAIFNAAWILPTVLEDFYKMENQIPYFVLETLFPITTASLPAAANTNLLAQLALHFFNHRDQRPTRILDYYRDRITNNQADPVKHLLDLYWRSFTLPDEYNTMYGRSTLLSTGQEKTRLSIESTQMLRHAGIKFRRKVAANSFLEVSFNRGTLEIPILRIDDKSSLLNFIAFEQCYGCHRQQMTSYAHLMNCLISNTADSEYLRSEQIIESCVGDHEEVKRFYRQIRENAVIIREELYFARVVKDINNFCSNKWRLRMAAIMHRYFRAAWAGIGASGAVIVFFLTAIQTLFTVLSYVLAAQQGNEQK